MWTCLCRDDSITMALRPKIRSDKQAFCPTCGESKPYWPDARQLARFDAVRHLARWGRYSEQIERPGGEDAQEVN